MNNKSVNRLGNPAPLGLMGFGMTTVLLNLHNVGLFELNTMILAMGICYGGLAQIFAGLLEFRKGNTFGATAFTSYGLFWISLVCLLVFPRIGWGDSPDKMAMAFYFFIWGVFTFVMFFGTLKTNRALQFVFMSLAILFWMLAVGEALSIMENRRSQISVLPVIEDGQCIGIIRIHDIIKSSV